MRSHGHGTPSRITLAVVPALCPILLNSSVVVAALFMFMLVCLRAFYCKPLHNSLSGTATRGLFLSPVFSFDVFSGHAQGSVAVLLTRNLVTGLGGMERKCVRDALKS